MENMDIMEDMVEQAYILMNMFNPPRNMGMDILNLFQSKDNTEIMYRIIELNTGLSRLDILMSKKSDMKWIMYQFQELHTIMYLKKELI